jgi:hypothetical protein
MSCACAVNFISKRFAWTVDWPAAPGEVCLAATLLRTLSQDGLNHTAHALLLLYNLNLRFGATILCVQGTTAFSCICLQWLLC